MILGTGIVGAVVGVRFRLCGAYRRLRLLRITLPLVVGEGRSDLVLEDNFNRDDWECGKEGGRQACCDCESGEVVV